MVLQFIFDTLYLCCSEASYNLATLIKALRKFSALKKFYYFCRTLIIKVEIFVESVISQLLNVLFSYYLSGLVGLAMWIFKEVIFKATCTLVFEKYNSFESKSLYGIVMLIGVNPLS